MGDKSEFRQKHLSETEKTFVEYYFDQSSPTFGNGTQSVLSAYGEEMFTKENGGINYAYAGQKAYELLRIPEIYKAGMDYMNAQGFNDASVDNQHTFLINQSADMNVKAKGIDMYNKLKGRYTEKREVSFPQGISVKIITSGN
jgi:hypothetical protein